MTTTTLTHEQKRNIAVKFIVYSDGWFMCATNWSKSYSAGVREFATEADALAAGKERTKDNICIYGFNEFGERIQ